MPTPRLGINPSYVADFATELPFVDLFRQSRPWISQQAGRPWGQGPALDLDAHGWPKSLGSDCHVECPIAYDIDGHYPAGHYTLTFAGCGTIVVHLGGQVLDATVSSPRTLAVDPARGNLGLRIMSTDPADPIRDIRLMVPGHSATHQAEPWSPAFLDRWRGVACLRFMDMMRTNESSVASWDERPKLDDHTWAKESGAPIEVMVDLCNMLGADAWFCVPHGADDGYVRGLAIYADENLDHSLKTYVEYSNETWNGGFPQHAYAASKGLSLGLATTEWEAAWRYTARRSVEIFDICRGIFVNRDRLVCVLPSQAGNPFVSEVICDHVVGGRPAHEYADALAIAPYFSLNVADWTEPSRATVVGWSVDRVIEHLATVSLPDAGTAIRGQAAVAESRGLELVAYEGGQHCVGIGAAANDDALTALFIATNAAHGMADLYASHLATWAAHGGGLYCHYNSTMRSSKFGSWGAYRYADEDSVKGRALVSWAASVGQTIGGEVPPPPPPPPPEPGLLPKARAFVMTFPAAKPAGTRFRVDVARDGAVTSSWL